jgi:hypothetical protein
MFQSSPTIASVAIERGGRSRPKQDKIVPRKKFGAVARLLWPRNTAANLAAIGKTDERTGKRWLRGEHEPPISVVIACIQEMLRHLD